MDFLEVIEKRHSVRRFEDRQVDREVLDTLISIASTAPSSKNCKSSAYMIIEDPSTIEALSQMRSSGSAFVKDAPAVIVVLGNSSLTDMWVENCSISATFLQLAATALDLGSCWVQVAGRPRDNKQPEGEKAEDYVRELLGIKDGMRIECLLAIGYEKASE